MSTSSTLVLGASGNTGGKLVPYLAQGGSTIVAAGRRGTAIPGTTSATFDWHDPSTYVPALAGVDRMYVVPPIGEPDPYPVMAPFLKRAAQQGVRRAVLLSSSAIPVGGPGVGAVHAALPEIFDEWAVLRPSWFMQNFTDNHLHADSVRSDDTIWTATGTGRVGFIDSDDIARVAATTLLESQPRNADLILTGPESLSYDSVAEILSVATGRTIVHEHLSAHEVRARFRLMVPAAFAEMLAEMDEAIAGGAEDRTTDTVAHVTGRPPRSFREYAELFRHKLTRADTALA